MESISGKVAKVASKDPYGLKIKGNDNWFNPSTDDIKAKVKDLKSGSDVTFEYNEKKQITKIVTEEKVDVQPMSPKPKTVSDYNVTQREQIMLGQSFNEALEFCLRSEASKATTENFSQVYKEMAKKFFKWNKEIYDEVFKK